MHWDRSILEFCLARMEKSGVLIRLALHIFPSLLHLAISSITDVRYCCTILGCRVLGAQDTLPSTVQQRALSSVIGEHAAEILSITTAMSE